MNAIDLLLQRQSCAKLKAPAPNENELDNILRAGLRAPDHAGLTPWRFQVYEGEGREKLANAFANALKMNGVDDDSAIDKIRTKPYRAPMVIVAIACLTEHPKVPASEQVLSAGCAVMAMQQMAQALGLGGMWRTGSMTYDKHVEQALGLKSNEQIVGFLYLGTPMFAMPTKPTKAIQDFVTFYREG